jgi:hypothetical protein
MLGQTSLRNEMASFPLQVETDQAALSEDVASQRSTRFLWTGFGVAVLMLIGVSTCVVLPVASHALASPPGHAAVFAYNPSPPGLGFGRLVPAVKTLRESVRVSRTPKAQLTEERQSVGVHGGDNPNSQGYLNGFAESYTDMDNNLPYSGDYDVVNAKRLRHVGETFSQPLGIEIGKNVVLDSPHTRLKVVAPVMSDVKQEATLTAPVMSSDAWGEEPSGGSSAVDVGDTHGQAVKAAPGLRFPQGTEFDGYRMQHLGKGKFGDAWEATNVLTGETVAVKVFHDIRKGEFLTWRAADLQMKWMLLKDIEEAKVVKEIVAAGRKLYPSGASRICECLEEHVAQGMTNLDDPLYTVWQMAGKYDLTTLPLPRNLIDRAQAARAITKQIAEGLVLLSMFNPPIIHHDLKPANIVVKGSLAEGFDVKIIDFGCFLPATEAMMKTSSMGDEKFMPPEWGTDLAFAEPATSFDMWAVGLIHLAMIAPEFTPDLWYPKDYTYAAPTGDTIFLWLRHTQPHLFEEDQFQIIMEDLNFIESCLRTAPGERATPIQAVDRLSQLLSEAGATSLVHEDMAFKAGDIVEMLLDAKWVECVVTKPGEATYDIRFCDEKGCRMYHNVDPASVKGKSLSEPKLYVPDSSWFKEPIQYPAE